MPSFDFQPTLENWRYIFFDVRNDTLRPYFNTVIVGLTSASLALAPRFVRGVRAGAVPIQAPCRCHRAVHRQHRVRDRRERLGRPVARVDRIGHRAFLILSQTIGRRFRRSLGNNDIAFWLISQRILPPVAVVIPIYVLFQRLGMLDTLQALIVTYVATNLPIVVWLMRDYFGTVPIELEESAAVDGASPYRIFRSIVVPVSVPGLVATFLFVLVFAWNEYSSRCSCLGASPDHAAARRRPERDARPAVVGMSVLVLIMIVAGRPRWRSSSSDTSRVAS